MFKMLSSLISKYSKFIKFLIVGVSNVIVFFIFYYILEFIWSNYQLSNTIAFIVSSVNGYFWNKNWVFNNKKGKISFIVKFYIVYIVTWLLSAILLYFWIELLKISENVAPMINLFITTPINYVLNKLWVFKNREISNEIQEEQMKKIRKAVIPAAGLGTRVLPATKAQPKEMLVIVDKPALQYLVEELVDSGIEEILIVTGRNKTSIENHFDYSYELEKTLEETGKQDFLKMVQRISNMANIYYVRQKQPLGLGHAIGCAESFIGDEPFVVVLGDDIIHNPVYPATKQLVDKHRELGKGNILGVQEVPETEVNKYGIVDPLKKVDDRTVEVKGFIEKPDINEAPSRLAALGRYVLEPEIFKYLKETKPGKGGEIQLTDAIFKMKNDGHKLYAYDYEGIRYDTGDKFGMFKATVEMALRHDELKEMVSEYLKNINIDEIK